MQDYGHSAMIVSIGESNWKEKDAYATNKRVIHFEMNDSIFYFEDL
jgi:hypothetical protein